jgi:UDP-2,3-diacylglucosamine hydrolase
MSDRTVVISDVHLGAVPPAQETSLIGLLDRLEEIGDRLLINGDLFDFWFEYRHAIPRGHLGVLAALRRLADRGVRVRFLGGNHDAWAGSFFEDEVGVELVEAPLIERMGGRHAFVAHGDGLGGGDWGYRVLKRITRSPAARGLFRAVHPDIGIPLARRASGTRSKVAAGPDVEQARAARLGEHARRVLERHPAVDLVIFGHTHRPELTELAPGRLYLNPGDWIHHRSFAVVHDGRVTLSEWDRPG